MNREETDQPSLSQPKRDFLKFVLGGGLVVWLGSILYPILMYLKPPKQPEVEVSSVLAGTLDKFEKESGTIVRFGDKPVILLRMQSGEFRAFGATCTHLDCTVQFRKDMGVIWCACHNGKYDLNGRVVSGPPPRPLTAFRVVEKGEEVYVTREGGT